MGGSGGESDLLLRGKEGKGGSCPKGGTSMFDVECPEDSGGGGTGISQSLLGGREGEGGSFSSGETAELVEDNRGSGSGGRSSGFTDGDVLRFDPEIGGASTLRDGRFVVFVFGQVLISGGACGFASYLSSSIGVGSASDG